MSDQPSAGRLRVLTWPVHGSYMAYLTHVPVDWYVPVRPEGGEGYGGRWSDWPETVREVAAHEVRDLRLDAVLTQSRATWLEERHAILSDEQLRLPRLHVEHDPPREHPTDTRHHVDDPDALLVHVTAFNALMWDAGETPTRVIDHGVVVPDGVTYTGELDRGLVVINELQRRGRRLGWDVFARARAAVPLDLVGMRADEAGGLGEVRHSDLPAFAARYRFFFHPVRYTSLGLAVCEAMMLGMPIVGLATTELVTVIENGVSGYTATSVEPLVERMRELVADPSEARRLGAGARATALERFGIERFASDWMAAFREAGAR
jgi:glycosyltransferase involved in cell wall biosynthesis